MSSSSDSEQDTLQGKVVDQRYTIGRKLGAGSFGEIHQVQGAQYRDRYAIKLEPIRVGKESKLILQAKIYQKLAHTDGFCRVYSRGSDATIGHNYLVMERLSYSLDYLFRICNKSFPKDTVFMIAEQLISRLQKLHQIGYVHRDLKPANFMVSALQDYCLLYLIDFGLAKPYPAELKTPTLTHVGRSVVGTAKYASLASHLGLQLARKDDMQSLGYLLVYFMKGSLPWHGMRSKVKSQKYAKMREMKESLNLQNLCDGLPKQILAYMQQIRKLEYSEKPKYGELRQLFRNARNPKSNFCWQSMLSSSSSSSESSSSSSCSSRKESSPRNIRSWRRSRGPSLKKK